MENSRTEEKEKAVCGMGALSGGIRSSNQINFELDSG